MASSSLFALAFLVLASVSGSAIAENVTATPEEVAAQISGKWIGSSINANGKYFNGAVTLNGSNGIISGVGDLPDSPADKTPKIAGTYSGSAVELTFSSNFVWHLVMTKDDSGRYHLDGTYAGARGSGKIVQIKQ